MNDFHRRLEGEIPRLRRYARALTRNAVRADDLVQDTLARALRKEHLWQPGTDLLAWLFTIMHNQNVNEVRRAMRDDTTVDVENCASVLIAATDPTASRQLSELERALGEPCNASCKGGSSQSGTTSSNPSCSSGESCANRTF